MSTPQTELAQANLEAARARETSAIAERDRLGKAVTALKADGARRMVHAEMIGAPFVEKVKAELAGELQPLQREQEANAQELAAAREAVVTAEQELQLRL